MHIAIVEDNPKMQEVLVHMLQNWKNLRKLSMEINTFQTGLDFLSSTETKQYQIVFMDIYLESESGIDIALEYRKSDMNSLLIFLTSSPNHMREAFPCRAFDYLLKPVKEEDLFHTLDEALRVFYPEDHNLTLTKGEHQYTIRYSDIRFVTSQRNYCLVQAEASMTYRATFRDLTGELSRDARFCLINRGILVNMDWVETFERGECLMKEGQSFPLHSKKQAQLVQMLIDYRFQKRSEHIRRLWND